MSELPGSPVENWTQKMINAECSAAYRAYEKELKEHYVRYFEQHPELRAALDLL